MGLTGRFIGKRIKYRERCRPDLQGEPYRRVGLLHRQVQSGLQESGDIVLLAWLGFETDEQSIFEHGFLWLGSFIGRQKSKLTVALLSIGRVAIVDIIIAMKVHVLVLDGVFDTGLATVLDAFRIANGLAESTGITSLRFDLGIVGVTKSIKTSHGLHVPTTSAFKAPCPWRNPDYAAIGVWNSPEQSDRHAK
jgi:hypothetical protein